MSRTRALIDTNVLIALEDPGCTDSVAADFARRCQQGGVAIYTHGATRTDLNRDRDQQRRAVSLSRMSKFPSLADIPSPGDARLEELFGSIRNANDRTDVALLHALHLDAVDVLVSQDDGLHRRVRGSRLEERVLTLADAVAWLTSLQDPVDDGLADVVDLPAYAIDRNDGIFDGLRDDYPGFESWWRRCIEEHRGCWLIQDEAGRIDGMVVRKEEAGEEIGLKPDERVLKLCTFKVATHALGHKVGELLLRKALWHAQLNGYNAVYLTTFPGQRMLLDLLGRYGFRTSDRPGGGELNAVKRLSRDRLETVAGADLAETARLSYPRFSLDEPRQLFVIPVQWPFHRQLFPEAAVLSPLPLFGDRSLFRGKHRAAAGNTIRKVYVCRASTKRMKGGDVVFFYQSKYDVAEHSQSITTVGVVEQVRVARDGRELSRLTAGRSVFSEADLEELCRSSQRGVTVIDFLHVQHLQPAVGLTRLLEAGVLRGAPQSITGIPRAGLPTLRPSMNFGFAL